MHHRREHRGNFRALNLRAGVKQYLACDATHIKKQKPETTNKIRNKESRKQKSEVEWSLVAPLLPTISGAR
jgi:hypothetical protein